MFFLAKWDFRGLGSVACLVAILCVLAGDVCGSANSKEMVECVQR
jgi:hypothetical protein